MESTAISKGIKLGLKERYHWDNLDQDVLAKCC
jgi:hypothetical protein